MANIDNPAGFRPLGSLAPAREYTASATIANGDLLAIVSGKVLPFAVGTHDLAVGVAAEAAANAETLLVWDAPDQEFIGQVSGTYVKATHDGASMDPEGTTGIMEVNENAEVWMGLTCKRHYVGDVDSVDVGANSRVVFLVTKHQFAKGAIGDNIAVVAAQTSPTAGNGSGADAETFNGAECDKVRAEVALNLAKINVILARLEDAGLSAQA